MSNLPALALLLAALFVAATALRTTVTTVVYDDDNEVNPSRQQQQHGGCSQRIQAHQQLRQCQQYLTRSGRSSSYNVLRLRGIEDSQQRGESLEECCNQLRQIQDEQCRCDGIQQIIREQVQQGQLQGMQLREIVERARKLPALCRLGQQQCEVSVGGGY